MFGTFALFVGAAVSLLFWVGHVLRLVPLALLKFSKLTPSLTACAPVSIIYGIRVAKYYSRIFGTSFESV